MKLTDFLASKVELCGGLTNVNNFDFFGVKPIEVDSSTREEVLYDVMAKRTESGEDALDFGFYVDANGKQFEAISHVIGDRTFTVIGETVFEEVDADEE